MGECGLYMRGRFEWAGSGGWFCEGKFDWWETGELKDGTSLFEREV